MFECWDRKNRRRVAIKVVRDVDRYREGAEEEIAILKKVALFVARASDNRAHRRAQIAQHSHRSHWRHCIVELYSDFHFFGHVCMTFQLYGPSLFDFMKVPSVGVGGASP